MRVIVYRPHLAAGPPAPGLGADFADTTAGELLIPPVVTCEPPGALGCPCDRAFVGAVTGARATIGVVEEMDRHAAFRLVMDGPLEARYRRQGMDACCGLISGAEMIWGQVAALAPGTPVGMEITEDYEPVIYARPASATGRDTVAP